MNQDASRSVALYCSEPNICRRCLATLVVTGATTALGVAVVMTTMGDDPIASKAGWIAAAGAGGLLVSAAAGLIHFVYSLHPKPPPVAMQTA